MGDILSQNEVDSLLDGLSTGKVETESQHALQPGEVVPYDFANQEKVIRGRMPTFQIINDRFANAASDSLSSLIATKVDIASKSIDTLKFSDFIRSLPVPASLHVFRINPLRGHAVLVLESQLVFSIIDTFFGGKGSSATKVEGRDFTTIENTMIRKVVVACLKDLSKAWGQVSAVDAVFVRSEMNPQFATIVAPNDVVIAVKFDLEMANSTGTLTLCLPYAMIEPLRAKLTSGFQSDRLEVDHAWRKNLKQILRDSLVNVTVCLGAAEITGERMLSLKVGDVVQLDSDAEGKLVAMVEDVPKYKGYAGVQRKFQAFRIEDLI